jgi:hypothetical protein
MKSIIVPRLVPAVAGQPAPRSRLHHEKADIRWFCLRKIYTMKQEGY